MDCSLYHKNAAIDQTPYLIMDNDSGYVSNNLDQESNSDSILDSSDITSSVDILKSFLMKPVFLSEDALLECPNIGKKSPDDEDNVVIDSSVKSDQTYPSFNSFQTDTEVSDTSLLIPVADPIYFDLNTKIHSSPSDNAQLSCGMKIIINGEAHMEADGGVMDNISEKYEGCVPEKIESVDVMIHKCEGTLEKCIKTVCDSLGETSEPSGSQMNEKDNLPSQILQPKIISGNSTPDKQSIGVLRASSSKRKKSGMENENSCLKYDRINKPTSFSDVKRVLNIGNQNRCRRNSENILSNLTNICDKPPVLIGSSSKIASRRSTDSKNKENISQTEVFKTPNKGVKRKLNESSSPDLFSDDENNRPKPLPSPKATEEQYIHKLDQRLLKRVQKELSGVPPPPDFTITKFSVDDILQKLEENKSYFWTKENLLDISSSKKTPKFEDSFQGSGSILVEGDFVKATSKKFPQILESRHHGLCHNRNKLSEEIEHLCDKYAKRYIGAETQSSCCAVETKYMSPARRKAIKQKWTSKSPGRRLSHLARRRITFSSANLQASSSSSAASRARQILIDYKKLELLNNKKSPRKSPRKTPRKTPNKSPTQGRTPSSSAKKKLRMRFRLLSGDFKDNAGPSSSIAGSKRALFQSPENDGKYRNILSNSSSSSSCYSFNNSELNSKSTKRSLFSSPNKIGRSSLFPSPGKKSPFRNVSHFEKKRKRDSTDEDITIPSKFFRSQSTDLRNTENEPEAHCSFSRAKSESMLSSSQPLVDLSAAHKKKLQWAVYESLKLQNISTSHPQFKVFASVLARVTRRFILSSNVRLEGGTSERMLRIARHYSFAVVKGKTVDEIMNEYNRNKARALKPQGYVAPDDSQRCNSKESSVSKGSAFKDRSNTSDSLKSSNSRPASVKPESRIDRIRKVINFEDNR